MRLTYLSYAKIRDSLRLNDNIVADRSGVSKAVLSRWRNGKSIPTRESQEKIYKVLASDQFYNFVRSSSCFTLAEILDSIQSLDEDELWEVISACVDRRNTLLK